jgi:hypothetical protein
MKDRITAAGFIKDGVLKVRHRKNFDASVSRMRDGDVEVMILRRRATRSLAQNRYYFGVIVKLLSDHTGYTTDEMHDVLKAKFLPKRLTFADGNGEVKDEFVIGGSTVRLTKDQFGEEYCEPIKRWAAELGVIIPDPNEIDQ